MDDGECFNFRENTQYDASLIYHNDCLPETRYRHQKRDNVGYGTVLLPKQMVVIFRRCQLMI